MDLPVVRLGNSGWSVGDSRAHPPPTPPPASALMYYIYKLISVRLRDLVVSRTFFINTVIYACWGLLTSQLVIVTKFIKCWNPWNYKTSQEIKREASWNIDIWAHKRLAQVSSMSNMRFEGQVVISQVNAGSGRRSDVSGRGSARWRGEGGGRGEGATHCEGP